MLGRSDGRRQDALETARMLVARGLDFDVIVVMLRGTGVEERSARAIAAEAFKPLSGPAPTLGSELRAIEAAIDRARHARRPLQGD